MIRSYIELEGYLADGVPIESVRAPGGKVAITGTVRKDLINYLRKVWHRWPLEFKGRRVDSVINLKKLGFSKISDVFLQLPLPQEDEDK